MRRCFLIIILFIALNAIVLPNAQQVMLAVALVVGAIVASYYKITITPLALVLIGLSWLVTMLYIVVGAIHGAPIQAAVQTIFIYMVSPALWLIVIDRAWKTLGVDKIVQSLAVLAAIAAASVAVYMFLFLNFGPQAVAVFGSRANVHIESGYSGVIMHVSGSLIFLGAAFASSPSILPSRLFGILILFALALACIASGRTLAIGGLIVGAAFHFLSNPSTILKRLFTTLPLFAVLGFGILQSMDFLLDVDVVQLLNRHLNKAVFGDVERPAQIAALMRGAEETWFLGAGHGIGVDYIRSTDFPWRYESVFFALIYKLGIVGTLVLCLPLIYSIALFLTRQIRGAARKYDAFFGSALVAVTLAANTNPYPEAFTFQWMFLIPIYYFISTRDSASWNPVRDQT